MSPAKTLLLITAILETILAIPVLGGFIVIVLAYTPLVIMLILHIITLVVVSGERDRKTGSIMGIVTSCLAWIPFLGWLLHLVSAILLYISYSSRNPNNAYNRHHSL